nr:hypothetical protein [Pseudonocardia sp. AL041005-10]
MRVKSTLAWIAGAALDRVRTTWTGRIVAGVLVLTLVAGIGGGVWWRLQQVPDGAALAVGDRVVTVTDLDDRVQTLRALYGVQPRSRTR